MNEKDDSSSSGGAGELGLANVGGVFVVLIGGLLLAALITLCEFGWVARRTVLEEGGPFWKGMAREFRTAIKTTGNLRPVKRRYAGSVPPN